MVKSLVRFLFMDVQNDVKWSAFYFILDGVSSTVEQSKCLLVVDDFVLSSSWKGNFYLFFYAFEQNTDLSLKNIFDNFTMEILILMLTDEKEFHLT
jgi:hypothetical protein